MILLRLAFAFLPELRQLLRWCSVVVFGLVALTAPMLAIHSQPWSPWWFAPTPAPAGVVPQPATQAPQGPLQADTSDLMTAIQPWLGTPYMFGGCSRSGVDCSCFTQLTARAIGLSLPRTAQLQYNTTERVSSPQPGDLVFFQGTYSSPDRITHVGWYVGDGMMISAIEPRLGRQSLSEPFWRSHFAGYGRIHRSVPNQA